MRLGYYTDGEKQGTLIDMYTPTMMGFELPYGLRCKRSRQVIDIIHTTVCRITEMVNSTMRHWSVSSTVFATMVHFVVFTVVSLANWVVWTSAGDSRSVSKEFLLGKIRCLEESMRHVARRLLRYTLWLQYRTRGFRLQSAIITYESLSDLKRHWLSSHENDLHARIFSWCLICSSSVMNDVVRLNDLLSRFV